MAAQNVKDMPLRRVVRTFKDECLGLAEELECGHSARKPHTLAGWRPGQRRRCYQCLRCQECGAAIYEHEPMAKNADGFWHADCANAPI